MVTKILTPGEIEAYRDLADAAEKLRRAQLAAEARAAPAREGPESEIDDPPPGSDDGGAK